MAYRVASTSRSTSSLVMAKEYVPGVSCGHCYAHADETAREGFRERQRQVELAAARGDRHIGKAQG